TPVGTDEWSNSSSSGTRVCGTLGMSTFFVPKASATPGSTVQTNYYRYRIHPDGVVIRSEYGPRSLGEGLTGRGCSSTGSGNGWRSCTQTTPTGRSEAEERTNFATWF